MTSLYRLWKLGSNLVSVTSSITSKREGLVKTMAGVSEHAITDYTLRIGPFCKVVNTLYKYENINFVYSWNDKSLECCVCMLISQ